MSVLAAMPGGAEADLLGICLQKLVGFMPYACPWFSIFVCTPSCNFGTSDAWAYFGAHGHGSGRFPGHAHCKITKCMSSQVQLSPLSPLSLASLLKKTCLSTRLRPELDRMAHAHAHALWHGTCACHVCTCMIFRVHAVTCATACVGALCLAF